MTESWPCPACHSINSGNASRCYKCRRPRATDAAKQGGLGSSVTPGSGSVFRADACARGPNGGRSEVADAPASACLRPSVILRGVWRFFGGRRAILPPVWCSNHRGQERLDGPSGTYGIGRTIPASPAERCQEGPSACTRCRWSPDRWFDHFSGRLDGDVRRKSVPLVRCPDIDAITSALQPTSAIGSADLKGDVYAEPSALTSRCR